MRPQPTPRPTLTSMRSSPPPPKVWSACTAASASLLTKTGRPVSAASTSRSGHVDPAEVGCGVDHATRPDDAGRADPDPEQRRGGQLDDLPRQVEDDLEHRVPLDRARSAFVPRSSGTGRSARPRICPSRSSTAARSVWCSARSSPMICRPAAVYVDEGGLLARSHRIATVRARRRGRSRAARPRGRSPSPSSGRAGGRGRPGSWHRPSRGAGARATGCAGDRERAGPQCAGGRVGPGGGGDHGS